MATCNEVIDFALRKLHALPAGRFSNAVQANNALIALKSIYEERVAQGLFGRLTTRNIADDTYTAKEGDRVHYTGAGSLTLTLPDLVANEECGDDEERLPRDLAVVVETGADPKTWIYDADIGDWTALHSLTLSSQAPLSRRLMNGLAAMLAVRIAPEWDIQPAPQVVMEAVGAMNTLALRWNEPREAVRSDWF